MSPIASGRGAKLVEKVDDVVEELGHWRPLEPMPDPTLTSDDACVYVLLSHEPRHIDDLARDSTLPPQDLLDALLRLELDGLVD